MKNLFKLLSMAWVAIFCSACTRSVSTELPHSKLIGCWRLKVGCYLMSYSDNRSKIYLVPSALSTRNLLPKYDATYDRKRIGETSGSKTIIGCLDAETLLDIEDVYETNNIEMGIEFWPVFTARGFVDGKVIQAYWIYKGFEGKGSLNPEFAEFVPAEAPRLTDVSEVL